MCVWGRNNDKNFQIFSPDYESHNIPTSWNKLEAKIGTELIDKAIEFIPEAHCYLKINGKRTDLTTKESEFIKIEKNIIQEKEIEPEQVAEFKVNYHKEFIRKWLKDTNSEFDFDRIWQIREKCIENLTE